MIEVRIRWAGAVRAVYLTEIADVDEIAKIQKCLNEWGIAVTSETEPDVFGQWHVDETRAYFEFVLE